MLITDWYNFNGFVTSGNAIVVLLKDVKEVHLPGSFDTRYIIEDSDDGDITDELKGDEIAWLLDQAKGFRVFSIGHSLLLFMKENECIVKCPGFDVNGRWNDCFDKSEIKIERAPEGDDFNILFELAYKLTPQGEKLKFPPGRYRFGSTFSVQLVELSGMFESVPFLCYSKSFRDEFLRKHPNATSGEIDKHSKQNFSSFDIAKWEEMAQKEEEEEEKKKKEDEDDEDEDDEEENQPQMIAASGSDTPIPLDIDLIVGEGDKQKTIKANKAVLATFLPKFESLLEDVNNAKTLVLPDLDHDAAERVLDCCTSRKQCSWPCLCSIYDFSDEAKAVNKVGERFGVDPYEEEESGPKKKKTKMDDLDHPAFNNPRWSDVTFIVGPTNEEINTNRAVLASLNPVLYRILYGTGSITVDPSQPIRWPDFDALAVKKVLLAMVQLGKKTVVVPIDVVPSAKALVDYLIETDSELNLYYKTPFAWQFENGANFIPCGKGGLAFHAWP